MTSLSLPDTWIIFCSLLSFPVLYSAGNLAAIDALFFGASGSTESGLNTYVDHPPGWHTFLLPWLPCAFRAYKLCRGSVDVKDLKTYQQVYLYVIPMITNLMFVNIMVVVARLYWFQQRLKHVG